MAELATRFHDEETVVEAGELPHGLFLHEGLDSRPDDDTLCVSGPGMSFPSPNEADLLLRRIDREIKPRILLQAQQ